MANSTTNPIAKMTALGGAAFLALCAAQPAFAQDEEQEASEAESELTEGEERLAKLLEGREAGEPQSCIRRRLNERVQTIDGTAYVYGRGKTIYVQRTHRPERIDKHDTLVVRRYLSSQICKTDIIRIVEPTIGVTTGIVTFEDFIPYTRVEEEES